MEYAIKTENLTKKFVGAKSWSSLLSNPFQKKKTLLAVNNVSLEVKKREIFCLLGKNGAGKTTLIKLLCALISPTSGDAYVNGYNIAEDKVRSTIGLVTGEERSFYWRLTGRQNLGFFASLYDLSGDLAKDRIEVLSRLLKIDYMDKKVGAYSQGMRQRLAIARSLINDPAVIFMDEPTKSLDPIASQEIRIFIKETLIGQQRKTVFFSTHDLIEAKFLADRLAVMEKGEIKRDFAQGELEDFMVGFTRPAETSVNHVTL